MQPQSLALSFLKHIKNLWAPTAYGVLKVQDTMNYSRKVAEEKRSEDSLERCTEVRGLVGCTWRGASSYGDCIPASHCQWARRWV